MSSLRRCPVLVIDPETALAPQICDLVGVPVCAVWHEGSADVLGEIRRWQPLVVVIRPWSAFGHARVSWLREQVDIPVIEVATAASTVDMNTTLPRDDNAPVPASEVASVVRGFLARAERRELVEG